jgi:hypothetical protein
LSGGAPWWLVELTGASAHALHDARFDVILVPKRRGDRGLSYPSAHASLMMVPPFLQAPETVHGSDRASLAPKISDRWWRVVLVHSVSFDS